MSAARSRAWRFDSLASLDGLHLHDEPLPQPQRGELLVRVQAVSLNYRDLSMVMGDYVHAAQAGLVPCSDAAGEVLAVGEGVTAFRPGDRVLSCFHRRWFGGRPPFASAPSESYGSAVDGWLCTHKVVSQEAVLRVPEALSVEQACTLPCAGTTAWSALSGAAPVRAGQVVLTLGTGGVSVFALQLAKAVGATVVATTSSAAKAERLRELGADHVIDYGRDADWGTRARAFTADRAGVDRVVEVGGPATLAQSLRAVRWGGEVVLVGFLSKENPGIDYFALKGSGALVRPVSVGDRPALEELLRVCAATRLQPVIDRCFAFEDVRAAFEHLRARAHVGKVVIRVGEG